jgi:NAD-dependent SIR2 family protein deacetylase
MKESVASMRSELKKRGIVTQANTPRITVFVRYVFNSDRKRSYNYTQTLLAAIEEKIDPNDLPEFINSKSGVEEIKRTRKTNADSIKQKAAVKSLIPVVKSELESMPAITSVKLNNPPASSSSDTCLPPL